MKKALIAITLVTVAQAAYAENSYEYTGARLPAVAKQATAAIPAPTPWTPPHRRPQYIVNRPVLHCNTSAGMNTSFSVQAFSQPTFAPPSFSAPVSSVRTGFSAPTFSAPTFAAPTANMRTGFSQPTFSSPNFSAPQFASGVR